MAKHALDIFATLTAIDRRDFEYLDRQEDAARKGFVPRVVLRWASAVRDADGANFQIQLVNERANVNFDGLGQFPDLQYRLLASCGIGEKLRHEWIVLPKSSRKQNKALEFLGDCYPDVNDMELHLLMSLFDRKSFIQFVEDSGRRREDAKEIIDAYDRAGEKGKAKGKS